MKHAGGQTARFWRQSHPDPCLSLLQVAAGVDSASRGPCCQLDHAPGPCLCASIFPSYLWSPSKQLPLNHLITSHDGTTLFPGSESRMPPWKACSGLSLAFPLGKLPWVLMSEPQNFHEMDGILDTHLPGLRNESSGEAGEGISHS